MGGRWTVRSCTESEEGHQVVSAPAAENALHGTSGRGDTAVPCDRFPPCPGTATPRPSAVVYTIV